MHLGIEILAEFSTKSAVYWQEVLWHTVRVEHNRAHWDLDLNELGNLKTYEKVEKGVWGMPRLSEAMKDVISCDKLRGLAHMNWSADFRMGQPGCLKNSHPKGGERRELKHLSTYRKRKQLVIPLVVASERGVAQTKLVTASLGL